MTWEQRREILMGYRGPVFAPEGEGGSGGAGEGAGEGEGEGESTNEGDDAGKGDRFKGGLLDRSKGKDGEREPDPKPNDTPDESGRPEHIPEKFWDDKGKAIKTEDLAKAYSELETAHGKLRREKSIGGEVPDNAEDYFKDGLELGEEVDRLSVEGPDDPGLKAWGEICHKYDIGKELATNLAKDMFGLMNQYAPEAIDPEAEMEKLGKGAEAIIDGVFTWVEGAEASGKLSEADIQVVDQLQKTADGIAFLVKMRDMAGEERIPLVPATGQRGLSQEQWSEEMKEAVKSKDYKRQAELDEMSKEIFTGQPAHGSRGGNVDPSQNLRTRKKSG